MKNSFEKLSDSKFKALEDSEIKKIMGGAAGPTFKPSSTSGSTCDADVEVECVD
jgi:hypothetical protein